MRRSLRGTSPTPTPSSRSRPGATADVFLVRRDGQRWVAKYAYQGQAYAEAGLAVSEVVDLPPWQIATPVRTSGRELTRLVEWPPGHQHPMALLRYVEGDVLDEGDPASVDVMATVCGRLHAQLLTVDPASVGVHRPDEYPPPTPPPAWALGEHQWLDDVLFDTQRRTFAVRGRVRSCVAVWDGPDVRLRGDGGIGLLDFGHTSWQPLVNVVANRSLIAAYEDRGRLARFLEVLAQELRLTEDELELLPLYRRQNAAGYARWAAREVRTVERPGLRAWLDRLVAVLERDLDD